MSVAPVPAQKRHCVTNLVSKFLYFFWHAGVSKSEGCPCPLTTQDYLQILGSACVEFPGKKYILKAMKIGSMPAYNVWLSFFSY